MLPRRCHAMMMLPLLRHYAAMLIAAADALMRHYITRYYHYAIDIYVTPFSPLII